MRDEVVTPFEPWLASLPDGDLEIITYGFEFSHAVPFPFVAARALAGAIALIPTDRLPPAWRKIPPKSTRNYVRRTGAELFSSH